LNPVGVTEKQPLTDKSKVAVFVFSSIFQAFTIIYPGIFPFKTFLFQVCQKAAGSELLNSLSSMKKVSLQVLAPAGNSEIL